MKSRDALQKRTAQFGRGATRLLILIAVITILPPPASPKSVPLSTEDVLVTVIDKKGDPVGGLQQGNFLAKSHRKRLKILSVARWTGPTRVLLLFDGSGSAQRWMPLERSIGLSIMRQAPPNISFAMALFARGIQEKVPFKEGYSAVANEVGALDTLARNIPKKRRKTALYNAIEAGISMFGRPHVGDTICVVTDGAENKSQSSKRQVARALLEGRVRVFGLLINTLSLNLVERNKIAADASRGFRSLIQVSGGMGYEVQTGAYPFLARLSPSLLGYADGVCRTLDLQLANTYVVKVQLPKNLRKREKWKLLITNQHGKPNPRFSTFYPRFLMGSKQK